MPKGPSTDPRDKRLAVQVEDHPVSYIFFEGGIPEGEYGAGQVYVWDKGTCGPLDEGGPVKQLGDGKFTFVLDGEKLRGEFTLVRLKRSDNQCS